MDSSDSDSDCDLAFANLDLTDVDFDREENDAALSDLDKFALRLELDTVANEWEQQLDKKEEVLAPQGSAQLQELASCISRGEYAKALASESAKKFFSEAPARSAYSTFRETVYTMVNPKIHCVATCVELELLGIAAFNIFLQLNYAGPTFDLDQECSEVNPHACFKGILKQVDGDNEYKDTITAGRHTQYQNKVLSELACDGQWPCQVVNGAYFLLLARCIFLTLTDSNEASWATASKSKIEISSIKQELTTKLSAAFLWSARATVAHERLLLVKEPTTSLWKEIETIFPKCIQKAQGHCRPLQAMVLLEFGLACYHFGRSKQGKKLFLRARDTSGLLLELTGAEGKRTKFQTKATAQLVVRAVSATNATTHSPTQVDSLSESSSRDVADERITSQMVEFSDDGILHERVQFEEEDENKVKPLNILDQAILLGMCLDIKDNNPADRLTAEEMSAYLARVLCHHDDWIVYSTALLERAWLEFEGNHTKERAILQMQALVDQHTNRLTITQSTRKSIEDSSPVQDRLKNLHSIVYPPRWEMLRDVAERYAQLGIVTSAAEIFTEIEFWDEVVDCYRRAGREKRAEEIVRERLEISETPRMWTALGDITNDPSCFEQAIDLSNGRFSQAYLSLGKYFFDKGDLQKAVENYRNALRLRPLLPSIWFRVGTISMQLENWDGALAAFSEVVQQNPDEGEAWANVAAVHLRNKHPSEAYPALVEALKHQRHNWRAWVSKLYTCLDLKKYDEAAQACHVLLDLRSSKSSQGVPELEEACVKAIVGGTVENYSVALKESDNIALDSARRSLVRVQELLDRIRVMSNAPWIFEATAYLHDRVGHDKEVYENLMKEYRSLTTIRAWEKDDYQAQRVCRTVSQIVQYQKGDKAELTKSKWLLSGVVKKIKQARAHGQSTLEEVSDLEQLLLQVTKELEDQ